MLSHEMEKVRRGQLREVASQHLAKSVKVSSHTPPHCLPHLPTLIAHSHTCTHTHKFIPTHTHLHTLTHSNTLTYSYTFTHTPSHVHTRTHSHTLLHTLIHSHTHSYAYSYIHSNTHTHTNSHMHSHQCSHSHLLMHAPTHSCARSHTHVHKQYLIQLINPCLCWPGHTQRPPRTILGGVGCDATPCAEGTQVTPGPGVLWRFRWASSFPASVDLWSVIIPFLKKKILHQH